MGKFKTREDWPSAALEIEDVLQQSGAQEMIACRVVFYPSQDNPLKSYSLTAEESNALVGDLLADLAKDMHWPLWFSSSNNRDHIFKNIRKRVKAAGSIPLADGVLVVPHWTGETPPEPPNMPATMNLSRRERIIRSIRNLKKIRA